MKFTKQMQKGFSLLELLLVVAVGAILILAGLAIYRNVTSQTQVNEASRLLNVLKQETQKLYQGEGTYDAAGTNLNEVLINANAVPSANVTGANTINSPFDQAVNVESAGTTFTITYEAVPQGACINMGRLYTANDPDFQQVVIDGTPLTAPTVAEVNNNCSDTGSDMVWTFN